MKLAQVLLRGGRGGGGFGGMTNDPVYQLFEDSWYQYSHLIYHLVYMAFISVILGGGGRGFGGFGGRGGTASKENVILILTWVLF